MILASLQVAGCGPAPNPVAARQDLASLKRLLSLMARRLALMHDVARWKWNEGKPILDAERERESLAAVVERGRARGLDPALVRAFFAAQMKAARLVQQADFDQWRAEGRDKFDGTATLAELRQRIDGLNGELLEALEAVAPLLEGPKSQEALPGLAEEYIGGEGLAEVREAAIAPLRR